MFVPCRWSPSTAKNSRLAGITAPVASLGMGRKREYPTLTFGFDDTPNFANAFWSAIALAVATSKLLLRDVKSGSITVPPGTVERAVKCLGLRVRACEIAA